MPGTSARLALVTVLSLTVLSVNRALASPIVVGGTESWFFNGSSQGCGNCRATVTFELLTPTSMRVSFENTSTDNRAGVNILTAIGFDTTRTFDRVSLLSQSIEGNTWALGNGIGSGNWEIGLVTDRGIKDGLDNESNLLDSGHLIIGWPSMTGFLTIDDAIVKFQNSELRGESVHAPGEVAVTTLPEPGTLLLLSAGLIAITASRRWRRTSRKIRSAAGF